MGLEFASVFAAESKTNGFVSHSFPLLLCFPAQIAAVVDTELDVEDLVMKVEEEDEDAVVRNASSDFVAETVTSFPFILDDVAEMMGEAAFACKTTIEAEDDLSDAVE